MDSILILGIVIATSLVSFFQEFKSEKALEALEKLATPNAKVIREGKEVVIPATQVVPGDILIVESGDLIAADAEIIEGEVEVDESILTGESKAVKKKKGDKIFSSTSVFTGRALARVYATGMKTEIGKIAEKLQSIEEKTPFKMQMERFTKKLVWLSIGIIFVTFLVAFPKFGVMESFLIAISLAVAAVPENLPAAITISLSLGARRMVNKNALVRRLSVVESIGTVNVVCSDKTGTITEGKMRVVKLWVPSSSNFNKELALECCFYCNDAKKVEEKFIGNETDIALKEYSENSVKEKDWKRIDEIPFASERKYMAVAIQKEKEKFVFVKGAPEILIKKCNKILVGEKVEKIEKWKEKILKKNLEFASKALRVIALAYKPYEKPLDKNLIFLGLVAIQDPPRKEVKEAIKDCYKAGIRVIMITGDNPQTALAIANQIGLKTTGVLTGQEIERLNEEQLAKKLEEGINVFARTNPFHKLKILEILKRNGNIVAMTGDGVNDALALKKADVGIAMGKRGTEVAKEASDMVLLDDNFAT
ncbi:MAG TPA: HAD family hydrolase, partial [bacterium]|nr:HAD family hydrolase [bacterium]